MKGSSKSKTTKPSKVPKSLVISLLANFVTVIVAIGTGWLWIDSKVETLLNERVAPYEKMIRALSMSQYQNHEEAIDNFYSSIKEMEKQEVDVKLLFSAIDPMLSAIAQVNKPHRYIGEFNYAVAKLRNGVAPTGDRYNSLGWVYLRVGENSKARNSFIKSIQYYILDDVEIVSANSQWGLALTYIVDGELDKAMEHYNKSWAIDYNQYNPGFVVNTPILDYLSDNKLTVLYSNFEFNYNEFLSQVNKVYHVEPLKYKSTIKG